MPLANNVKRNTDTGDYDREWTTDFVKSGLLDVTVNTSSARTKTLPSCSAMLDLYKTGDVVELIVINSGAEDLELLAAMYDGILGNTTVPAGGFRLLKMVVNYGFGGHTYGMLTFCS